MPVLPRSVPVAWARPTVPRFCLNVDANDGRRIVYFTAGCWFYREKVSTIRKTTATPESLKKYGRFESKSWVSSLAHPLDLECLYTEY